MPDEIQHQPGDAVACLVEAVGERLLTFPQAEDRGFVGSDLVALDRVMSRIQAEGLAPGLVFCEWGSGLGGGCGVAALNGFKAFGIEIQRELVEAARSLAEERALEMCFAAGTFLLPGDQDLTRHPTSHTRLSFNDRAWSELNLAPGDCDVVFAYPWPSEEIVVDAVFARHASPDALLVTFHDHDRVFVQRKVAGQQKLLTLGWM
jgi:hypothetical protein